MLSRLTAVGRVIGGGLNQGEFVVGFPVGTRYFTLLQIFEAGPFVLRILRVFFRGGKTTDPRKWPRSLT
jgi:hypothetical protein